MDPMKNSGKIADQAYSAQSGNQAGNKEKLLGNLKSFAHTGFAFAEELLDQDKELKGKAKLKKEKLGKKNKGIKSKLAAIIEKIIKGN